MTTVHTAGPLTPELVTLDRCGRLVLAADGWLALALGTAGVLAGRLQAELTGLPAWLFLAAGVGLLAYSVRALQVGRAGVGSRARVEGLALLNLVWALVALALPLVGWVEPNPLGVLLVAAHVVVPGAVGAVLVRSLRSA